jgi:hypothetical protein
MEKDVNRPVHHTQEERRNSLAPTPSKQPWQEPRLKFIEPTLTQHGKLEELTGQGFFGGFSPARR